MSSARTASPSAAGGPPRARLVLFAAALAALVQSACGPSVSGRAGDSAAPGDPVAAGDRATGDFGGCVVSGDMTQPGDGASVANGDTARGDAGGDSAGGDTDPGGAGGDSAGGDTDPGGAGGDSTGGDTDPGGAGGDSAGGDRDDRGDPHHTGDRGPGGDPQPSGDRAPPGDPVLAGDDACEPGDLDLPGCSAEMVPVGGSCVDRYEASRPDATADSPGVDGSMATSRAGVLPWYVAQVIVPNPLQPQITPTVAVFEAACVAAGKRLCRTDEWLDACDGPCDTTYTFGDQFEPETCNSVETFCDDYCVEQGIPLAQCYTGPNCGYYCGYRSPLVRNECFHVTPTGSFPGCTNAYGAFDVNGNVWEIVSSTTATHGYRVRGGAFNCGNPIDRLDCTFYAEWTGLYAGFRCCKDRN